jgi:Ca2+-binding RTX toxin-like protein
VVLGPVNVQDQTLQSLVGKSDQVYLFAQGFLTVPGSGSYNDFILSTTSDDGVRVKIDLAGTGAFSNVINNYTDHGSTVDNSSPQSVTAGQRIPIQIEWFESGGGATLELYYQSSSQGIGRTLVPLSNLSSSASSSTSGSLDLGSGDDTITFQSGALGVGTLSGGAGTDVLNFASYGSGVSVDLASGTSTGTTGISGFERVIGSSANDTLIASSSDANLLVGNDGNDSFGFSISGLTTADTVQGGAGRDTLVFSTAGTIDEAQFSNVSSVEQVALNGASSFNLGTASQTVGIDTVLTGSGTTEVSTTIDGYDLAVDANSLANNTSLSLSGSSASNDFVVSNLKGDLVASSTSGSLSLTTADNTVDNSISITIGTGATTITGGAGGDTLSIDAALALENSNLTLAGSSNQSVTGLVGDIGATSLSGSLTVTTGDADDDGISIITGTNNTTITASGTGDIITVNANSMADNTTLTLSGSATETVTNLQANVTASGSSGALNLSYKDVADNAASITTGSGATTVTGSSGTDTLTINASGLAQNTSLTATGAANQSVTGLVGDISATSLSGSLNVTTGDAGDQGIAIATGSANTTINASGAGDTITVNADAMADNTSLTLTGSSSQTVSNLQANANASGSSGAVNLSYKDVADNAASITTGSGATTVSSSTSGDTLSINAAALAQNTALTLTGSSQDLVTGLVGDISATNLTGSLTVTTGDAGDNGISITTGSANTTINASGSGDTVTVNANPMAYNTSLTLTGSASQTVSNLQANVTASGTSGAVNLSYKDVADDAASITTGSGATMVSGSSSTDTLSINANALAQNTSLTASGAANQVVTGLVGDISATSLSGTLTVTTGDAADNSISIATGSGATSINSSGTGDTVTTNATALAQDTRLTLSGTANQMVSNLVGDVAAANSSGTLTITTADAANNGISIATGSNNAYINGTASSDTLSIDAAALAQGSSLNLQGSSAAVVSNLVGDLNGYTNTSSLTIDPFDSAAGWTNGSIYSASSYYGNMLGLYADGAKTNGQDTYKNFDFGGQATSLSFDFARIDSWDGESFRVYIDDVIAFEKAFQGFNSTASITSSTGSTNSYAWSIAPKDSIGSYAGVTGWTDQTATITINIPAGKYNTKIGFGSTLNQGSNDESYAIDNLTIPTTSIATLSGPLTVTTGDAADNAINIVTGTANTTITASGAGDTVTVNANTMADNTLLDLNGSSTFTVNNLEANTDAAGSSGAVNLSYKDVADNAASITTGSGATTVNASGAGDAISLDAGAMADNKLLTLIGASTFAVSGLQGDLNASATTGNPLSIGLANVAGDQATAVVGSGNVVLTGGDGSDKITVTGLNTNNQTLTALSASANFNITAGAGSQTITGSNTGSDTIDGGAGTDTLSYAGGQAVDLSVSDYGRQAGVSSGPGTDQFSGIELLVGSGSSSDVLRGGEGSIVEIATIQTANAGSLSDRSATGSFQFTSFENLDLNGGDDTLTLLNDASMAGAADGGDGRDTLDYTQYTSSAVTVDLGQNTATAIGQGLVAANGYNSFENVDGTAFSDKITGDSYANVLRGFDGGDTIDGADGNDTIDGGNGTSGSDGADLIYGGKGADLIFASAGNDTISGGQYGVSSQDGSDDILSYTQNTAGLEISLTGVDAGVVLGTAQSSLSGSDINSTYNSGATSQLVSVPSNQTGGSDWTQGFQDIQSLVLSGRSDIVRFDGNDSLTRSIDAAGGSFDTLDFSGLDQTNPVMVNLSDSSYSFDIYSNGKIDANASKIILNNAYSSSRIGSSSPTGEGVANGAKGFEVVIGTAGNDAIVGNGSDNILAGNDGNDYLAGGAGDDTIYGGNGDDFIAPGDGKDTVYGGLGINVISISSDSFGYDNIYYETNSINIVKVDGSNSDGDPTGLQMGNSIPQGINLIDGGDPTANSVTKEIQYDKLIGTPNSDQYDFSRVALKNIGTVDLGDQDDDISTSATTKGVKVAYLGGTENAGDSITLNFTFDQLAKLNQSGSYVADVQSYIDDPNGNTFSSNQADFSASQFEFAAINAITPAIYNQLQGDPAALTFNSAYGVLNSQISGGQDVSLSAVADTTSTATAASVGDIVSALVQANNVKGAENVQLTAGGSLSGAGSAAKQSASASAITVDDRSDSVLSAYALGVDRSSFIAGNDLSLSLSGQVDATTLAQSQAYVAKANGTVEVAGSRDSSFTAGDGLNLIIGAKGSQTVEASNGDGLARAGLASRAYGIDDANITDASGDAVSAGADLNLTATATTTNRVTARTIKAEEIGPITLVPSGSSGHFTTTLSGNKFPLIEGDRLRFTSSSSDGAVQAGRDYFVINAMPDNGFGLGDFQLASMAGSTDAIELTSADILQVYRPAVALADGLSTATAVDLNGAIGLQAGGGLELKATASDQFSGTATSMGGDAVSGLNRLGGLDGLDASNQSLITALSDTTVQAGGSASLNLQALDGVSLNATSTAGGALTEANSRVIASAASPVTAGEDLNLSLKAALTSGATSTSTAGAADARSGAGAGVGVDSGVSAVGAAPNSYGQVVALANATQTAGDNLTINATASGSLSAKASTVDGGTTLNSIWASPTGNLLSSFDPAAASPHLIGAHGLREGQTLQLQGAAALGLDPAIDYSVRLLGFGVNDVNDTLTYPDFDGDGSPDITLKNGDVIRFKLNSGSVANSNDTRYGLELGTSYYVVNAGASSFQLATAPSGTPLSLSADSIGAKEQLIDADRFQLLVPAAGPGLAPTLAPITAAGSGLSFVLPATATALAGGRQAFTSLNGFENPDLASVIGLDGSGGTSFGLISGAQSSITALADGLVQSMASGVADDATASAGLQVTGVQDMAIVAGDQARLQATANALGLAEASSTGDVAGFDNSLSSLTISASGLSADAASQSITVGGDADLAASAAVDGRSTATIVTGDADALGVLSAIGLQANDSAFDLSVGADADLRASARIGSSAAPLEISAIAAAVGDATAQASFTSVGVLGVLDSLNYPGMVIGGDGSLAATAAADINLQALATAGQASASLTDLSGTGASTSTGLAYFTTQIGDQANINSTARLQADLEAATVTGDANSGASTKVTGILGDSSTPLLFSAGGSASIASLAQNSLLSRSLSVAGIASSDISSTTTGQVGMTITIGDDTFRSITAKSNILSQAVSVGNTSSA